MTRERCIIGDCPGPGPLCDKHRAHLAQSTADYFTWKGERAPKPKGLKKANVLEVSRLPQDPLPLIRWS
jgi:hypothetical protein